MSSGDPDSSGEAEAEVILALGSNLGDRMGHLRSAVRELGHVLSVDSISPVLENPAQGLPAGEEAPDFLNAVLRGRTSLEPEALLRVCHDIEESAGRPRSRPRTSRTLDLDIVFYGDRVKEGPGLVLPHPRWKERSFVLRPLVEVAPKWRDPVTGSPVEQICRQRADLLSEGRVVAPGGDLLP